MSDLAVPPHDVATTAEPSTPDQSNVVTAHTRSARSLKQAIRIVATLEFYQARMVAIMNNARSLKRQVVALGGPHGYCGVVLGTV